MSHRTDHTAWAAEAVSRYQSHSGTPDDHVIARRSVPIRRSAMPFCQGDLGDIGRSRIPIAPTRAEKTSISSIIVPNQIGRCRRPGECFPWIREAPHSGLS
jgi:hypothetical protein